MKKTVAIAATAQMDMITEEKDYEANLCNVYCVMSCDILISSDHFDIEADDRVSPWKR